VQERGEQRPVSRTESRPRATELPLQYSDLMPQGEDLEVFVSVAHREQAEHGKGVCQAKVGQSQQHSPSSCRDDHPAMRTDEPLSTQTGPDQQG
jgi:hypothetical protein